MGEEAPRVEVKTTMGTFVLEMYVNHAPKTCHNFIELSRKGYYDGTIFHRIIRCDKQLYPCKRTINCPQQLYGARR